MGVESVLKVVGGDIVGGVSSLLGANKGSNASKDAAKIQAQFGREALAEQKRVYDLESQKEADRYKTTRADLEYDRSKTLADEGRVRASRQNAFGGFSGDLDRFSKGYAPAYGMSAGQTQGLMDARNQGFSGGGRAPVAPMMGDKGQGPGPDPMSPSGPQVTNTPWTGPMMGGPSPSSSQGGGALGSTVWLQSPDGQETMEVSLQDAPKIQQMLSDGAVLIPAPTGAAHGMV